MADEYIWRKYRIEVEHLCATKNDGKVTYEKMFYQIPNRKVKDAGAVQASGLPQKRRKIFIHKDWFRQDSIRGFPVSFTRKGTWCQHLKIKFSKNPTTSGKGNIVEYLGIAADEPDRFGQLNERKRAPLVEFGIEEDLCGLHCQYEGILAPTYETSCRDGCWFCHNQGIEQLRALRKNHPDLWALLLKWDADSPVNFKPDGHTVHDYDLRFSLEDQHMVPTDRRFRWEMLKAEYLQLSLF